MHPGEMVRPFCVVEKFGQAGLMFFAPPGTTVSAIQRRLEDNNNMVLQTIRELQSSEPRVAPVAMLTTERLLEVEMVMQAALHAHNTA